MEYAVVAAWQNDMNLSTLEKPENVLKFRVPYGEMERQPADQLDREVYYRAFKDVDFSMRHTAGFQAGELTELFIHQSVVM